MTKYLLALLCFSFISCDFQGDNETRSDEYKQSIDQILLAHDLKGTVLILDDKENTYYSNDFQLAQTGYLPASTFKITNSIIALEANVIQDEHTILKWDGQKRDFDIWEKDMSVRQAFQSSCLPCYRQIARDIGVKRMKAYLNKLHYNNMDVNESTIDNFWISGESRITPFEQIVFLKKFYTKKLPILNSTYDKMLRIFEKQHTSTYVYYGKSGWSTQNNLHNGWFVGLIERDNKVYYFALNAEPIDQKDTSKFLTAREQAIQDVLKLMHIL